MEKCLCIGKRRKLDDLSTGSEFHLVDGASDKEGR